jgi:glycosyltransferase involved in cell wall biosynthesis
LTVHRLRGGFGAEGLRELDAGLDAFPAPRTLLVQYAPQAFGMRGMNVGFTRWVRRRARAGDDVRVMFHEPFVPFGWRPRRNVLAAVTHLMARTLLAAAGTVYVSVPAWAELLRPWAPRGTRFTWLPIPSTIPRVHDPEAVAAVRERVLRGADQSKPSLFPSSFVVVPSPLVGEGPGEGGEGEGGTKPSSIHGTEEDEPRLVVGHFGTYGEMVAPLLRAVLGPLLAREPRASALLLGDGGPAFARTMEEEHPQLRGRFHAPGFQSPEALSIHLQACDLAIQPYPDGASSRRTTLMAPLSHGVATVTTTGCFTESEWRDSGIPLAPAGDAEAMVSLALALLGDGRKRTVAAAAGERLYTSRFAMERTVRALLGTEAPSSTETQGAAAR